MDETLGLIPGSQATRSVQNTVVRLASKMPFREAASVLEQTSGGVLSHQMIHRILQALGSRLDMEEKLQTQILIEDGELPRSSNKVVSNLFVEDDGTIISLQREAKKKAEMKLLVSYEGWKSKGKRFEKSVAF